MADTLGPAKVVFACVANAGRSQMAAAFFNTLANPARARAISAGTRPGTAVHPEVVTAMRELDIDLSSATPQYLSTELVKDAHILITMGCGDECPLVPGVERDDWPLDDPKGQPKETVRRIRDEIRTRVAELVKERKWR
jgi:arsenate reductase